MKELSLHIFDITENSITAGAENIEITICENSKSDSMTISISDDGKGMDAELLESVTSPFTTSRTTRKVGLGIPLFKDAAMRTGGDLSISSAPGKGTSLRAWFVRSHIDRQPLGDIAATVLSLVTANEHIDFLYSHTVDDKVFTLDTKEIKQVLGGVPFSENEVYLWLCEYLKEGEESLG